MEELFNNFTELYTKRSSLIHTTQMGEDSIRYDFFVSLMKTFGLNAWEIIIEQPIHSSAFIPNFNQRSYRKEKPLIDLCVPKKGLEFCVEFGSFRQNSNELGDINKTGRLSKMFNDFIRVALHTFFSGLDGYFVCVADKKILGHHLRSKLFPPFPAEEYLINNELIMKYTETVKNKIDKRFINQLIKLNIDVKAKLIYNHLIETKLNLIETRVLIWKIEFN